MISNSKFYESNNLYKIKDFCLVGDGAHASLKRQNSGIMYLTSKNFKPTGLDLSTLDFISENDYKKYFTSSKKALTAPLPGDILFGIIGSLGVPYILKKDDIFGISSSVAILRPQLGIISKYLYYFMVSPIFQGAIDAIKSGVAQSFLSLEMIRNLPLIVPKKRDQKKIAAILSAYDDLIEKNNRRIAILEKMAEEIYREWFVRLRFPGHEQVKFNKAIPEGWEVKELKDANISIIDGDRGSNYPKKEEFSDLGYCLFLNTGNIKNDKFDFSKNDFITQQKDLTLRKGKLIYDDIVITTRGTVGNIAFYSKNITYKNVRINSGMVIFREKIKNNSSLYLYYLLKSSLLKEQYKLYSSGAAQPQLPIKDLKRIKVLIPSENVTSKFCELVSKLNDKLDYIQLINNILKQTRDRLLTRLISGKLSVENLDIQFSPSMIDTE